MGTPVGDIAEGISAKKQESRLKPNEEVINFKVMGNKGFDKVIIERDPVSKEVKKVTIVEVKQKYGALSETATKGTQGSKQYIETTIKELDKYGTVEQKKYAKELKKAYKKGLIESKLERVDITTGKIKAYDLDIEGNIKYDTKTEY